VPSKESEGSCLASAHEVHTIPIDYFTKRRIIITINNFTKWRIIIKELLILKMIVFLLLISRHGKTRMNKYYKPFNQKERQVI
jgi:hypothetical protein